MLYEYQDTYTTVRAGLGGSNYATCKLKPSGSWTTVKTPAMPRTESLQDAINNFHKWAEEKNLEQAGCGCCWHNISGYCEHYQETTRCLGQAVAGGCKLYVRCEDCFEKGIPS